MKCPDSMSSPYIWLSCSVIMSFITGFTTRFFTKKNQVSDTMCIERRDANDKFNKSMYKILDKKLDYLIKRIDDHFDNK